LRRLASPRPEGARPAVAGIMLVHLVALDQLAVVAGAAVLGTGLAVAVLHRRGGAGLSAAHGRFLGQRAVGSAHRHRLIGLLVGVGEKQAVAKEGLLGAFALAATAGE